MLTFCLRLMLMSPGTRDPSGGLRIKLASPVEAKTLEQAAHSQPVEVGGELLALRFSNAALHPLPRGGSGNAWGATEQARARAPPGL